jgi:hypothetical protein
MIPSFQPQPGTTCLTKVKQLDWVGAILNAGLYTSFVLALTLGGGTWAWNDGRTIGTFVACFVILVVFTLQQFFSIFISETNRLFPISFLKSRTMILLHIASSCAGAAQFVPIFYIPLLFQFVRGDSGLQAAVRLLPFVIFNITTIMGSGIIMPLIGYYYPFYIVSGILTTIGAALMYTVTSATSTAAIYGYSILIAIGTGLVAQAAYSIAPAKVHPSKVSDAIGFINVAQIGGIVLTLSISGAVFQNTAFRNLSVVLNGLGFTESEIRSAIAGSQSTLFERVSESVKEKAIEAIVKSIGNVYALALAAGALGLVVSMFLKREKLFMDMSTGGA